MRCGTTAVALDTQYHLFTVAIANAHHRFRALRTHDISHRGPLSAVVRQCFAVLLGIVFMTDATSAFDLLSQVAAVIVIDYDSQEQTPDRSKGNLLDDELGRGTTGRTIALDDFTPTALSRTELVSVVMALGMVAWVTEWSPDLILSRRRYLLHCCFLW